jgi:hypothetical protein
MMEKSITWEMRCRVVLPMYPSARDAVMAVGGRNKSDRAPHEIATAASWREHDARSREKKFGAGMAGDAGEILVWAQILFCQMNYWKLLEMDIFFLCHNF